MHSSFYRNSVLWIALSVTCLLLFWTNYQRFMAGHGAVEGEPTMGSVGFYGRQEDGFPQQRQILVQQETLLKTEATPARKTTTHEVKTKETQPPKQAIIETRPKAMAGTFELVRENNFPDFEGLTVRQADAKVWKLFQTMKYDCQSKGRFGKSGDGGYTICLDEGFAPKNNSCLVYSFGIRNEWSFDDAMYDQFGCEVHSFDPSMVQKDHMHSPGVRFHQLGLWGSDVINDLGWNLMSMGTLIKYLGHQDRIIDVLKIDVEGAEWPALQEMLAHSSIRNVRQMIFEIHTPKFRGTNMTVADYGQLHHDLTQLQEQLGFQLYMELHGNGCCGRFTTLTHPSVHKEKRPRHLCCYELFYVNRNFAAPNEP